MRGCSSDVWKGKNGPPREYIMYMKIPMAQVVPYFVTSCSTMKSLDKSAYLVIPVNECTCVRASQSPARVELDHQVSHHTYLKMHLVATHWDPFTRNMGTLSSKK